MKIVAAAAAVVAVALFAAASALFGELPCFRYAAHHQNDVEVK